MKKNLQLNWSLLILDLKPLYDHAFNVIFRQKLESVQYNTALTISGAMKGTSREKLYHELGFESLESRRRKLCCFYKVFNTQPAKYLFDVILTAKKACITRNEDKLPQFKVKQNDFKSSFFPSTVAKWNKLDLNIS